MTATVSMILSFIMKPYVLVLLLVSSVHGQSDDILKSSLTFVIDNSYSMKTEIKSVKKGVNDIFDTVMKSASTQIENFILITFNDDEKPRKTDGMIPDRVKLLTNTKDPNVFKEQLESIIVDGGGDCPEYAMNGIELALKNSIRGSYIFVFTDAPAKDYKRYKIVRNLAENLQSQIFIVLTETKPPCKIMNFTRDDVQKYYELATATNGEVFRISKRDFGKILEYIKTLVEKRQTVLIKKNFPPGSGNKVNFTVDSKINQTVFVVTGQEAYVHVYELNGTKVQTIKLLNTTHISIVSAKITTPGLHVAEVGSKTNTSVTISGSTSIHFLHGFSVLTPSSINDTTTKPVPDTKLYLSIKLIGDDVKLETVKILNMQEETVMEIPLEIVNDTQKFYLTKPFIPPNIMFKVEVTGCIIDLVHGCNETISRISLPVEIQNLADEEVKHSKPTVTIDGGPDVTTEYGAQLQLKCQVDGYPPPDVFWEEKDIGILLSEKVVFDFPSKFISILNIDNVNKTGIYQCTANNSLGEDTKFISVEIKQELLIIEKNITYINITRGSNTEVECKILKGKPKPQISWHFKSESESSFHIIENNTEEKIHIKDVNSTHAGAYKCKAINLIGEDVHTINLVVEYPPMIEKNETSILVKIGEEKILKCIVHGVPTPDVTWYKNGTEISGGSKYFIGKDNQLLFSANVEDSGSYECKAINKLDEAKMEVKVDVYDPVSILAPEVTILNKDINEDVFLCCDSNGHPTPNVTWTFKNSTKVPPIPITPTSPSKLILKGVQPDQHGNYTCTANNSFSSAEFTFTVNVNSPPKIRNIKEIYDAVTDDLVLKIPCEAAGYPKPNITWIQDGVELSDYISNDPTVMTHTIEEDGTLIYKNINDNIKMDLICQAVNGNNDMDLKNIAVSITSYSEVPPTSTVNIEEGKTLNISCGLPYEKDDSVRWYKSKKKINNQSLQVDNVSLSDAGIYTCRVSNCSVSISKSIDVKVGFKPRFNMMTNTETQYIDLKDHALANLSCDAVGEPKPEVVWWRHGSKISSSDYKLTFNMLMRDLGIYHCNISNNYGKISRTFVIHSNDCFLDIKNDFLDKQPLIQASADWLSYETANGTLRIPKGHNVNLACPKTFTKFRSPHINAICDGKKSFKVNGKVYKYSDFKCTLMIKTTTQKTGKSCLPGYGNTETINVVYEVFDVTEKMYEVCLDKDNSIPVYAKYKILRSLADVDVDINISFKSELLPLDFDSLYDCKLQKNTISSVFGGRFHINDKYCFIKRQLVNPRDMIPGLAQKSTFNHLNIVPQWGSCNNKNWHELERKIRSLAKSTDHHLLVWTGTSYNLSLIHAKNSLKQIYIRDKYGKRQPVPIFLWKVVRDPNTQTSLAIIQVNFPDFSKSYRRIFTLCTNICKDVVWMKIGTWDDVNNGYTYCCNIQDFEKAFHYPGVFNAKDDKVLQEVN